MHYQQFLIEINSIGYQTKSQNINFVSISAIYMPQQTLKIMMKINNVVRKKTIIEYWDISLAL